MSGAKVDVVEARSKKKTVGTTDSNGTLHLSLPGAGSYDVEVKVQGFKGYRTTVRAVEHKTEQLLVKLNIGEASVIVGELVGLTPFIDKTESQVTNTFSGSLLQVPR